MPWAHSPASDIALIYDGLPLPAAQTAAHIGARHFKCFAHLLCANTIIVMVLPPPSTPPRCAHQVCQVFVRMPVDSVATAREAEDEGVMDVTPAHEAED
jgi:hypothetical protein